MSNIFYRITLEPEDSNLTWYMLSFAVILGIMLFLMQYIARKHDNIPTLAGYSKVFGHTRYFVRHSNILHDAIHDLYLRSNSPKISHLFVDGKHLIMIQDIKMMHRIFNRQKSLDIFEKDTSSFDIYQEIIGQGIIISQSSQRQHHRIMLQNMLLVDDFNAFATKYCNKLVKQCMRHKSLQIKPSKQNQNINNHREIEIVQFLDAFTLDLFVGITFDQNLNLIDLCPKHHIFSRSYKNMIKYMNQRRNDLIWKVKRWFNCKSERLLSRDIHKINNFIKTFIKKIKQKDDTLNENNLLSLYLNINDSLTKSELKDIAMNFMFFGREKTKSLISWCLYELCRNINIKEKLIESLNDINDSKINEMKYKDVANGFKYLEACLLETMRLHPMIPIIQRRALFDIEIDGEHIIRENDYVMIHLWTLCRDSKIFKNPFQFIPNRWIKDKDNKLHKLFFNVGLNSCLGKDMVIIFAKIFFIHFLKAYQFELAPNQEIRYSNGYLLQMGPLGMDLRISGRDMNDINTENVRLVV